jgi:hypothetical protein
VLAASKAMGHVESKSGDLHSTLLERDPSLEYFVEIGFNEGAIKNGGILLEEIHIFITASTHSLLEEHLQHMVEGLSKILSPFPAFLHEDSAVIQIPVLDATGNQLSETDILLKSGHILPSGAQANSGEWYEHTQSCASQGNHFKPEC